VITRFDNRRLFIGTIVVTVVVALFAWIVIEATRRMRDRGAHALLNISYDPTREFYREINSAFEREWESRTGKPLRIEQSHAGSVAQARAVIEGLEADVVTLASRGDIDSISQSTGLIAPDWRTRLPYAGSPYFSTVVFLVRAGNPRAIRDWTDLLRSGLRVATQSPRVSGGGRWVYLAAWGAAARQGGGPEAAFQFVSRLYAEASIPETGARASLSTFLSDSSSDVLLIWEDEARYARAISDQVEIVYPRASILAEPAVAVVDRLVDRRGTRAAATAYLEFLFSREGQETAARHHFRPRERGITSRDFPEVELFTVEEIFGSWEAAQSEHFAEGGTFDRILKNETLRNAPP
jgi:sulfate/thiosulfate-binding protein